MLKNVCFTNSSKYTNVDLSKRLWWIKISSKVFHQKLYFNQQGWYLILDIEAETFSIITDLVIYLSLYSSLNLKTTHILNFYFTTGIFNTLFLFLHNNIFVIRSFQFTLLLYWKLLISTYKCFWGISSISSTLSGRNTFLLGRFFPWFLPFFPPCRRIVPTLLRTHYLNTIIFQRGI